MTFTLLHPAGGGLLPAGGLLPEFLGTAEDGQCLGELAVLPEPLAKARLGRDPVEPEQVLPPKQVTA